jgi:GT2 family glycosyltransferase
MKKVSLITVNYNQPEATEELLQSIIELNTYPLLEVIVVDNASKENKTDEWSKRYPQFSFIRSEENLGFAGGNNLGIRKSSGDYLFLINNDTVITTGLIEKLAAFLHQHIDYAVVSPIINYYAPNTLLQYAGFTKMNFLTARNKCIGQYETNNGQYNAADKLTWYAHGAAMMLRRRAVEKVGLMPEAYFLYYEEMDWCEMFRRAGYKVGLCAKALVYHKESISTGKNSPLKSYYMNRNRLLFVRRNASVSQTILFFLYFSTVVHGRFIIDCLKDKQINQLPLFVKALLWNIKSYFNVKWQ